MSRARLYEYQNKQYTLKELADMKYPVANIISLRAQIKRMGVEAAMDYDPIKGEQLGKKVGQRASKGSMFNYVGSR